MKSLHEQGTHKSQLAKKMYVTFSQLTALNATSYHIINELAISLIILATVKSLNCWF